MRILKNKKALSSVIGVILIVAITVILAEVLAGFVLGSGGFLTATNPPNVKIRVKNNYDTPETDLIIAHEGGDTLRGGEWKLSIAEIGNPPVYVISNLTSDFSVGLQIDANYLTNANSWVSNSTLSSGGEILKSNHKYNVKLVHIPSRTMLADTLIMVTGNDISVPVQHVAEILSFINYSVSKGTLTETGQGNSKALMNKIEAAGNLIEKGSTAGACSQLKNAYNETDGLPQPPDFVMGDAAPSLANQIQNLMTGLGCK